jgi:hypothetical protein
MCDDDNKAVRRFVNLGREIIRRIHEELEVDGEWWLSVAPLAFELERMRRELYPEFGRPGFLLASRIGERLQLPIPTEWIADEGASGTIFDFSEELISESWLLMSDPVTEASQTHLLDVAFVGGPNYEEAPGVYLADLAILCLRRWIRAVREGTVAVASWKRLDADAQPTAATVA